MKTGSKTSPTYLVRTLYSYCFRYTIPQAFLEVAGKSEIRGSIKTIYIGKAKGMA